MEGADALEPAHENAYTILRYRENNMSAAVASAAPYRVVTLGFPFESLTEESQRNELMQQIMNYLENHGKDE
ncbi:MAG: hypothetical protein R2751_11735 [Bacteroidales bacterium]